MILRGLSMHDMSLSYKIAVRALPKIIHVDEGDEIGRRTLLYILSVVMVIVAGLFVTLRMCTRLSPNSKMYGLRWDDYLVLTSLASSVALSVCEIEATTKGYGDHANDLTAYQLRESRKSFYGAQVVYSIVITLNKAALLSLYLRIFPNDSIRVLSQGGLVFVVTSGIAFSLATIFQCTPIALFWDPSITGGYCIPNAPFWMSYGIVTILTDFFVMCVPIPTLYCLTLSRKTKWGIIFCFAIGGFVCFTTIIRLTTLLPAARSDDPTFGPVYASSWSVIEANTGLICNCLPMLKQYPGIIAAFLGRRRKSTTSDRQRANSPRTRHLRNLEITISSVHSGASNFFETGMQRGTVDSQITDDTEHKVTSVTEGGFDADGQRIQKIVNLEMCHIDSGCKLEASSTSDTSRS